MGEVKFLKPTLRYCEARLHPPPKSLRDLGSTLGGNNIVCFSKNSMKNDEK